MYGQFLLARRALNIGVASLLHHCGTCAFVRPFTTVLHNMKCTGAIPVVGSVSVPDPCTSHSLLQPTVSMAQQVCTYKHKETLRKRCKDCYYIKRHNRWYVECRSKPRHKQMEKLHKSEIYRWYWHCLKQCDCLNNIVFDELWIISSTICIVKEVVIVLSFNQKTLLLHNFS